MKKIKYSSITLSGLTGSNLDKIASMLGASRKRERFLFFFWRDESDQKLRERLRDIQRQVAEYKIPVWLSSKYSKRENESYPQYVQRLSNVLNKIK